MSPSARCAIGKAKSVLVSRETGSGVVATVVARLLRPGARRRLTVSGPVTVAPETKAHLQTIVVPMIHHIVEELDQPVRGYRLTILSPAALAATDLDIAVTGFSLDVASALAMLSASLRLPIRQDLVSTGHIASSGGDIRPIGSLPEKLRAATSTAGLTAFAFATYDDDGSLATMTPHLNAEIASAIAEARKTLRLHTVSDIAALIEHATHEEARVRAALTSGYFDHTPPASTGAAATLTDKMDDRFWRCLEARFAQGRPPDARRLLELRLRHSIRLGAYPDRFGGRLRSLVGSIPPVIRRRRHFFPLADAHFCFELGRLAKPHDKDDATDLLCATLGRLPCSHDSTESGEPVTGTETGVDAILSSVSAESIARDVAIPIDEARASFHLSTVVVEDHELFTETITAFHLAMLRHAESPHSEPQPDEAMALLDRAFANHGGVAAARSECRHATQGGMRLVLDTMADQFKREQRYKRIRRVLKDALDPLDWQARVRFIQALMDRMRPLLPPELADAAPERFARRYEDLIRTYVSAFDEVRMVMRTF